MDERFIPLLSGKKFSEFTPDEFKAHVESLYNKPEKKVRVPKKKKPFTFKVTKTGKISLTVNREPKAIYDEELCFIGFKTKIALARILEYMEKKKIAYLKGATPEGDREGLE